MIPGSCYTFQLIRRTAGFHLQNTIYYYYCYLLECIQLVQNLQV